MNLPDNINFEKAACFIIIVRPSPTVYDDNLCCALQLSRQFGDLDDISRWTLHQLKDRTEHHDYFFHGEMSWIFFLHFTKCDGQRRGRFIYHKCDLTELFEALYLYFAVLTPVISEYKDK